MNAFETIVFAVYGTAVVVALLILCLVMWKKK